MGERGGREGGRVRIRVVGVCRGIRVKGEGGREGKREKKGGRGGCEGG